MSIDPGQWAAIASAVIALAVFVVSFVTARSANQRALRERLRVQLRAIEIVCHVHFKREGWEAVRTSPQYSFQALDHIHQDGLVSPSRAHIAYLKSILRQLGRRDISLPRQALGPEEYARLTAVNELRLKEAFESLDLVSNQYLRALGKMDNAGLSGYWTYLRYRLFPPACWVWRVRHHVVRLWKRK